MLTTSGANATEQFRAYGAVRGYSGSNPSRYQFTGQYIDNTGLYYYNARYYDPQIGTFLSPDTLVPDPGNVQAYNRYLYALGNPIRYNDPSGHCNALEDGSPDLKNDAGCWAAADEWLKTFGIGDFANVDDWHKLFTANSDITEETLRTGLYAYWSPIYRETGIYHPLYNPPPEKQLGDFSKDPATQLIDAYCSSHDCIGVGLDGIGTGASVYAVAASLLCGPTAPACGAGAATGVGAVSSVVGIVRGLANLKTTPKLSSGVDLGVTTVTGVVGYLSRPKIALAVAVLQQGYDMVGGSETIKTFFNLAVEPTPGSGGGSGGFK